MPTTEVTKTTVVHDNTAAPVVVAPIREYVRPAEAIKTGSLVYYVLDVIELLLAVRVVFKLLGASTTAGFTRFLYAITDPLVAPFRGIFPTAASGGSVLDWAGIVAMIIYALLAWAIVALIDRSERVVV